MSLKKSQIAHPDSYRGRLFVIFIKDNDNLFFERALSTQPIIMKSLLCFFLVMASALSGKCQPGCTDPQATNYDPSATSNDGSCTYAETNYTLSQITELPQIIVENSGLVMTTHGLFTHNDAGNPNEIYRIDSINGAVLQTLLVVGDNEDWEDFAESETHIFIGDFGNNDGNRTDLRIYKIDKSELGNNIVNAQPINFTYADQIDFSENHNNHDYDCEAFFYHDDSLHLFTKNWVDNQTRHYVIPAEPGFWSAPVRHSFNAQGLLTSADINSQGTILLLGYTPAGFNYMWLLFDYPGNEFFQGNKRKIMLGTALTNSQTEGLAFKDLHTGYISSEQFDLGSTELPPKLLGFNIEQWVENPVSDREPATFQPLNIYPNPFSSHVTIRFPERWTTGACVVQLFDAKGHRLWSQNITKPVDTLVLDQFPGLASGVYSIQVTGDGFHFREKLVKL